MDYRTIRQSEIAECGLACLAIASGALGAEIDLAALRRRYPVSSRGLNLEEVIRIAAALDMTSRAVRCEIEELKRWTGSLRASPLSWRGRPPSGDGRNARRST